MTRTPAVNPRSSSTEGAVAEQGAVERVLLALTGRCNLRCVYCHQTARKPASLPWEALQAAVDLAMSGSSPRVGLAFSGGEPLLEFELLRRAVEYAETARPTGKRLRFSIGTNGLLLCDEIAEFLARHEFAVQLSFDGLAPAQSLRGAGTFEVLDRLLDHLRVAHPKLFRHTLSVAMTVTPLAVGQLADSVQYFIRKEVRDLRLAPDLADHPGWELAQIRELDVQIARVAEVSCSFLDRTGEVPVVFLRKSVEDNADWGRRRGLCGGLSGSALVVDADGQACACPLLAAAGRPPHPGSPAARLASLVMGDVGDKSFAGKRAAALERARELVPSDWDGRRYSSYGRCRECRYFTRCSVCPASACGGVREDEWRVPDFTCAFNQVLLKHRDLFPCAPGAREKLLPSEGADPLEPLERYLRAV